MKSLLKHNIIFLRPVAFGVLTLFTLLWIASIQTAAGENTTLHIEAGAARPTLLSMPGQANSTTQIAAHHRDQSR